METPEQRIQRVVREEVAISPYDPAWPEVFRQERRHLRSCLPNELVRRIEHFGSTAVPGLAAKPIVDMLVEVTDLQAARSRIAPALEAQGYEYFWRPTHGDDGPPFYAWFIKRHPQTGARTHHIHMVEGDFADHWDRLFFRDFLIERQDLAREYGALKVRLASASPRDRLAYTRGKTEFITRVTREAKRYYGSALSGLGRRRVAPPMMPRVGWPETRERRMPASTPPRAGPPRRLTPAALSRAAGQLAESDPDLGSVLRRLGEPPMWGRTPGFSTLIRIILEQQVSLAAARTVYRRLTSRLGAMTPEAVHAAQESGLRDFGLTRQKARYCHGLATRVLDGSLDLTRVARSADAAGRKILLEVPGLGPWSVDIYYLMALRRPDVWPQGDLALAAALQDVKRLEALPTRDEQQALARGWAPWRSVAARILWVHYLAARGQYDPFKPRRTSSRMGDGRLI